MSSVVASRRLGRGCPTRVLPTAHRAAKLRIRGGDRASDRRRVHCAPRAQVTRPRSGRPGDSRSTRRPEATRLTYRRTTRTVRRTSPRAPAAEPGRSRPSCHMMPVMSILAEYERYDGLGLAELVRRKEVKPEEVLEAAIRRIEARNPAINAVVTPITTQARGPRRRRAAGRARSPACRSCSRTSAPLCTGARPRPGGRFFAGLRRRPRHESSRATGAPGS